ncbi:MAG: hypothetical protein J2P37_21020 [Ktedonobacteraceae bacterium]|nr:hypothetical protein [Ktedonobacteraceae bacterium]MBO0795784.1 hypothetical protein [Ktedonobacteraceae bacterium]
MDELGIRNTIDQRDPLSSGDSLFLLRLNDVGVDSPHSDASNASIVLQERPDSRIFGDAERFPDLRSLHSVGDSNRTMQIDMRSSLDAGTPYGVVLETWQAALGVEAKDDPKIPEPRESPEEDPPTQPIPVIPDIPSPRPPSDSVTFSTDGAKQLAEQLPRDPVLPSLGNGDGRMG